MRAPGEATGTVGLEIALDELAEKLNIDPVQLRLAQLRRKRSRQQARPGPSKHLRECYAEAAERFGWSKRNAPNPAQQVARATSSSATAWPPPTMEPIAPLPPQSSASFPTARVYVGSAPRTSAPERTPSWPRPPPGSRHRPPARRRRTRRHHASARSGGSGGSTTAASVCPAVYDAALRPTQSSSHLAVADPQSPLHGAIAEDLETTKTARLFLKSSRKSETSPPSSPAAATPIEGHGQSEPPKTATPSPRIPVGAVFAEVAVDADTHMVQVRRIVGTYDIGTLMNNEDRHQPARRGGIAWGSAWPFSKTANIDPTYGRTVNENFAEYHVPVNADIYEIDVACINIPDYQFNSARRPGHRRDRHHRRRRRRRQRHLQRHRQTRPRPSHHARQAHASLSASKKTAAHFALFLCTERPAFTPALSTASS